MQCCISCCYAAGYVVKTGTTGKGGLVGYRHVSWYGNTPIVASYYSTSTTKMGDETRGFGVSSTNMKKQETYGSWDFDHIWAIDPSANGGFPTLKRTGAYQTFTLSGTGTKANPYVITTEAELAALARGELTGSFAAETYFKLGNDIALTQKYWTPIGGNGMPAFAGTFDGDGHTVSGLDIAFPGCTYEGLFGQVSGTVQNLDVTGTITGAHTAGLLAGHLNKGTIEACSSSGSVSGGTTASEDLGGLVGYLENAAIRNSYSTAAVTSSATDEGNGAGGLVGDMYGHDNGISSITSCYAAGKVTKTGEKGKGGLVGYQHVSWYGNTPIVASYYNTSTTKMGDETRGFMVTTAIMRKQDTFGGWDFDNIWEMPASTQVNSGFPTLKRTGEYQSLEPEGSGTEYDPYVITTAAELYALARGEFTNNFTAHYQLGADITLTQPYWTPIGGNGMPAFAGIFDGCGHTISGLSITALGFSYEGLFGEVSGTVQNLDVAGTITSARTAGLLVGHLADGGSIEACSSSGSVSGGTTASADLGGLVGYMENAAIRNSYSAASVTSTATDEGNGAGGLVGDMLGHDNGISSITSCYAAGKVTKTGEQGKGGLVGFRHASWYGSTPIVASYYNTETTGMTVSQNGFGIPSAGMANQNNFAYWDFENIWTMGATGPVLSRTGEYHAFELEGSGTELDPYVIYEEDELAAVARGEVTNCFTSYYELANHITLTQPYWTPIGGNGMPAFSGHFDGKGYTISGLDIPVPAFAYEGLFGSVTGTVKNLHVQGTIRDAYSAGLLAGHFGSPGVMEQCSSSGSVTGTADTGGLVGYMDNSTIQNCYSTASVGNSSSNEADGCGGLVGDMLGRDNATAAVTNAYAAGTVSKNGTKGLGGLVGYRHLSWYGTATVTSSYFDNYQDAATDRGTAKSTEEMKQQATYGDWDFTSVWGISASVNGGYPYLLVMDGDIPTPPDPVKVTGVSLNKESLALTVGSSETLAATVAPADATNKAVTWSSSDTSVATVLGGRVTAVKAGTATITVTTADGGKTAVCAVTVTDAPAVKIPVTGVMLNKTSLTLTAGSSESLTATVLPANATNKDVTWTSSDATVATVSGGRVTGVKDGSAAITVTTADGSFKQVCKVTVGGKTPVDPPEKKTLTGIAIESKPTNLVYQHNEKLNTAGLVVSALYSDGSTADVTASCTLTGYDAAQPGTQSVIVSYQGFTASFTVTVSEPTASGTVAKPVVSITAVTGGKQIALSCATANAKIYYTTDGKAPTDASTEYASPIFLDAESTTLKAVAYVGGARSSVTTATVSVPQVGAPAIYPGGSESVNAGTLVTLRSNTAGATIYYTLDGSIPTTGSTRYNGFVSLQGSGEVTVTAIAVKAGCANSAPNKATYTVKAVERPKTEVNISVGSVEADAGTVAAVPVYLFAEGKVTDFTITLSYPHDAFDSAVSISPAEGLGASQLFSSVDPAKGTITLKYAGDGMVDGGELCTLNLTSLVTSANSSHTVAVAANSTVTVEGKTVSQQNQDGTIKLGKAWVPQASGDITYTIQDGTKVNDLAAVGNQRELEASVSINSTNATNANVYLAIYDRQGRMVSVETWQVDLSDPAFMLIRTIKIPENVSVGAIKIMVLSDAMVPLMAASELAS